MMEIERLTERVEPKEGEFVFVVYPSPRGTGDIYGYMNAPAFFDAEARTATFLKSNFGVPVVKAFDQVQQTAMHYHVDKIIISDPDDLFQDWQEHISK
ncbi:MAG: hypothetical protein ACFHHU_00565 [Porticoccaceae bacterium]